MRQVSALPKSKMGGELYELAAHLFLCILCPLGLLSLRHFHLNRKNVYGGFTSESNFNARADSSIKRVNSALL